MKHYSPVRTILLICFCMLGMSLAAQQPSPDSMVEVNVTVVDSEHQPPARNRVSYPIWTGM